MFALMMSDAHFIAKSTYGNWDYIIKQLLVIGYDIDIHHWIPILTTATAPVNNGILRWIVRHIQWLNRQ